MKKRMSLLPLALLLFLTGCGVGTASVPSAEPIRTVRYGLSNAWDALMPYSSVSGSNYARIVYDKIYDRLAYVNANGDLDPRAAKRWESTDGGWGIRFYLDEKSKFHDGTPVTAEHWAETFRLMTDPACPTLGRASFGLLVGTDSDGVSVPGEMLGAEAVDTYTFQLTFKQRVDPEEFLLDKNREFYVLPTHLLQGTETKDLMSLELWSAPVGSGPCRFVSELPGSQLVLEANPDYPLGAPGFDELIITVMDKTNLLTALIAGDLDYYAFGGNISPEDVQVAEQSGLAILEGETPNTFYELMVNGASIPDARIRQAIDYALDKSLLCEQSAKGLGTVAGTSIVPTGPYGSCGAQARPYDSAAARALLEEAGYQGQTYTLACTSNRMGLAALIQQQLSDVGLSVEIETVDSATMFAGMSDGTYDLGIASHTPSAVPLWFVESRFAPSNNIFHVFDLDAYTGHISAIRAESDQNRRKALIAALDAFLYDERPFVPLWFGRALHVVSPTVQGIDYDSSSFSNENVWEWVKQ